MSMKSNKQQIYIASKTKTQVKYNINSNPTWFPVSYSISKGRKFSKSGHTCNNLTLFCWKTLHTKKQNSRSCDMFSGRKQNLQLLLPIIHGEKPLIYTGPKIIFISRFSPNIFLLKQTDPTKIYPLSTPFIATAFRNQKTDRKLVSHEKKSKSIIIQRSIWSIVHKICNHGSGFMKVNPFI